MTTCADDYSKSLTIAQNKPLRAFLTTARETSLQVWNYESRQLEHSERLENEASLVAIHPSGLYTAVSFPSKVKMFCIIYKGSSICMANFKISMQLFESLTNLELHQTFL
jgi:hypothetical protein